MKNDIFGLSGKTAVITGGGGVLGGSMAGVLAERGVAVALLDLREEASIEAAKEIVEKGGRAIGLPCDVLDQESLEAAKARVIDELGSVDILINAAGGNDPKATTSKETLERSDLIGAVDGLKTFFDLDADGIRSVFDLNVLGTLLATQIFGRVMAERGRGVIINISSMNAFKPLTRIPAYSAAKAGVSNFTQWLATHFAPLHIRVNAIAPGFFLSDQNQYLLTDERTGELTPRGAKIIAHTPMGRFGRPEDLAGALVWLVSDASAFVTGIVLPVDGGFSAFPGV
ncbi:MAG: SDR family oxidoreductase [Candidatus Aminicenantales bacterium]|jgi:NAD(P)-dependent dehydrogenase (short-subunit alcohol dehydrogenase family)